MPAKLSLLVFVLVSAAHAQGERVVVEWTFDTAGDLQGWEPNAHTAGSQVAEGVLSGRIADWDPFITSPQFDFGATPWQTIEIRARLSKSGQGQVFYTNTLDTQYAGFSPEKNVAIDFVGGDEMRTYRIRPFWQAEKRIIKLRLDLPGEGEFAIESIRIIDSGPTGEPVEPKWRFAEGIQGWQAEEAEVQAEGGALKLESRSPEALLVAPPVRFPAGESPIITVRMRVDQGDRGELIFASDEVSGLQRVVFPIRPDDQPHTYNIEACSSAGWRGQIIALALRPTDTEGAAARIESIEAAADVMGPSDLQIGWFGLDDVVNRAGEECPLVAVITNQGGEIAKGTAVRISLPDGVTMQGAPGELDDVEYGFPVQPRWVVRADRPLRGEATLELRLPGHAPVTRTATLEFTPRLDVPKADYVPEPQPVATDYQVGVYYFPGWHARSRWNPIETFPERKPILGWYDESLPEIADWQIKWAAEHGVSFFVVDWYWSQGGRSLEHWLHGAYLNSRYREYLRFCLLWANHNPEGSSSHQDCLDVTRYWIDNYFKLPEYQRVDGKPVMVIFSVERLRQDLGSEGVTKAFDAMDALCEDNGIPGIYMVACTASTSEGELKRLADEGYDAVSGYNYPGLNANGRMYFPYEENTPGYKALWETTAEKKIIREIPVLSGGWDSRPWHGDRSLVLHSRTPDKFEAHCRDAKAFLDANEPDPARRMCIIEAWNEWGEGSYIGPHREFGFGYLDAIRNVFTDAPREHVDLTPKDVGLGPYDLPPVSVRTEWDFDDGTDQGWGSTMGFGAVRVENGVLVSTSSSRDPAFFGPQTHARASRYPFIVIRMRVSQADTAQLFWSTTRGAASEGTSVRFDVIADGQFHDYRVRLADEASWRGQITSLRLDPANQPGTKVEVDSIRLETD